MAWIAPVVSALGAAYSAQQQKKASKKLGKETALEGELATSLRETRPIANRLLQQSTNNMGRAENFWGGIARGGHAGALGMLAPQIQQADQQQQAAMQMSGRMAPRSGGSAEGRLGLMDSLQANRNNQLLGLGADSYNQLANIGNMQGNMGSALLSGNTSGSLGLIGAQQNRQQSAFEQSRAAAASWAQAFNSLANHNWGGK
jgi:hypothetical protein